MSRRTVTLIFQWYDACLVCERWLFDSLLRHRTFLSVRIHCYIKCPIRDSLTYCLFGQKHEDMLSPKMGCMSWHTITLMVQQYAACLDCERPGFNSSLSPRPFLSVRTHCTVTVTIHAFYERNENYKKRGYLEVG